MSRWVAAALLLFLVESSLGATVPREVLWIDKEHVQPMFVPEEFLNEQSWDDLPGSDEAKNTLRFYVERAPKPASDCQTLKSWNENPASYAPTNFEALLGSSEIAVTGKVIGQVAGWSTWENRVATMVYVRVTEVLRDVNANVQPGDVAIVSEHYGDITVKGAHLCVSPQPGYYAARTGDEVLLIGHRWDGDARMVVTHFVYPISSGRVATRAFTPIETGAVALESVRGVARKAKVTQ